MATWRLAAAETLILGDAVLPLATIEHTGPVDERIAYEALRGIPIVRVAVAEIVSPGHALGAVLTPDRAEAAEVELSVLGRGDVRRVVWMVESSGPGGHVRRAVDAHTGLVLSGIPDSGFVDPTAILLTRRRAADACDLTVWSRCVVGLPLSVELGPAAGDLTSCPAWQRVLSGSRPPVSTAR